MKIVHIAVALLSLVAVGCGQPEVGTTGTGRESVSRESPPPADLARVTCQPGEVRCGAAGTNDIFRCIADADGLGLWNGDSCAYGCIHAASTDGLDHDYCSQCDRGPSYCENGQRWSCGSDGYYKRAGACSRCDCGGTYPHCRICQ